MIKLSHLQLRLGTLFLIVVFIVWIFFFYEIFLFLIWIILIFFFLVTFLALFFILLLFEPIWFPLLLLAAFVSMSWVLLIWVTISGWVVRIASTKYFVVVTVTALYALNNQMLINRLLYYFVSLLLAFLVFFHCNRRLVWQPTLDLLWRTGVFQIKLLLF